MTAENQQLPELMLDYARLLRLEASLKDMIRESGSVLITNERGQHEALRDFLRRRGVVT